MKSPKPSSQFLVVLMIASLVLALSPVLVHKASATSYVPGVKIGDWWNYGPFETTCKSCPTPIPSVTAFTFIVTSVSGNTVSLRGTAHYSNGTTVVSHFSGGLDTGSGNLTATPPLIAAGLSGGDRIFNATSAPRINYTASLPYAGENRQVNVVNSTSTVTSWIEVLYYDQQTGINTEIFEASPAFSIHIVMTGTNLWTHHVKVPDDPSCNSNDLAPCGFQPLQAFVTVGTTVKWDNIGNLMHAVASCTGQITSAQCPFANDPSLQTFSSGPIKPNSSYSLRFNTTGIYYYYDPLNVGMKALVAVQGNATAPPNFSMVPNPRSLSVIAGNSNYTTILMAPLNGFLGLVSLYSSFPTGPNYPTFIGPQGDTINLGIVTGGGTTLLVRTNSTTLNGVYTATVTGAGGGISNSVNVSVTVTGGRPDFTISANPTQVKLPPFGNGTFFHPPIVTITSVNGFQGPVNILAQVNPPGLNVELSSASPINNASLVLTLTPNGQNATGVNPILLPSTPPGIYTVTVTATSGSLVHTTSATFVYGSPGGPGFSIQSNPSSLDIPANGQGTSTITLLSMNGFSGIISLSSATVVGIIPIGGNSTIFPGSIPSTKLQPLQVFLAPNSTAIATLTVFGNGAPQRLLFIVNVTGTSGTISRSTTVTITVLPSPADFSLLLNIPFPFSQTTIAGGTISVGVSLISVGSTFFNGTVTLAGKTTPFLTKGPTVIVNPDQIRLVPPGPSFATAQISTTSSTPPGNYTLIITGTSGTLTHTSLLQFIVLPPPVISVAPSSGVIGTQVTVHGSGFPTALQGSTYPGTPQVDVTFDDQFVGFVQAPNGQFDFTFNIPEAQSTQHEIHAIELFPISVTASANFTVLPEPNKLVSSLAVGSLYFPGETALVSVSTSINGYPTVVSSLVVVLLRPDGSNVTLATTSTGLGLYKAAYTIPPAGLIGTYTVLVKAHTAGAVDAVALASFEVKLSWLASNGRQIAIGTGIAGAVGVVGVIAFAWQRGYLKRKDEPSTI